MCVCGVCGWVGVEGEGVGWSSFKCVYSTTIMLTVVALKIN